MLAVKIVGTGRAYSLLGGILLYFMSSSAQVNLKINSNEKPVNSLNYRKTFATAKEADNELSNIITALHYKGYLLASVDSVFRDSTSVTAFVTANSLIRFAHLRLGNLNPNLAS